MYWKGGRKSSLQLRDEAGGETFLLRIKWGSLVNDDGWKPEASIPYDLLALHSATACYLPYIEA